MRTGLSLKDIGCREMDKKNQRSLIPLLGSLTALDPLSIDMYLPAFGQMSKDFGVSISRVELSVTTFFLGMAIAQLAYGPLSDRFGRKRPLQVGMLIYFLASIACALSPNIEFFIAARLLQAMGGCAGMVITRAIIRDLYDSKQAASFLSNMALIMGIAPIVAPSIGSFIFHFTSWQMIFFVLAGINFLCMISIGLFLPETNTKKSTVIKIGPTIKAYLSLFKDQSYTKYLFPDMALRSGMFAYIAGSPFVFIDLLGIPSSKYGLVFGLNGIGLMIASQLNRALLKKYEPDEILRWSLKLSALASIIVFISGFSVPNRYFILSALFVFIGSLNFISPNTLARALSGQGHQAGLASALYGFSQWTMAAIASFLVSHFHSGSAITMTGVIMFCGLSSFIAHTLLSDMSLVRKSLGDMSRKS